MKFVDCTEIRVRSGAGGRGLVSFRSAAQRAKGGADGGDGGFGGSVYLQGDSGLNTLSGIYFRQLYTAEDGQKGGTNGCTGRNGEDLMIPVPLGTIAINKDTGVVIGEVLGQGETLLIAKGGKRGLGNMRYLSSRHQAPEEYTTGGASEEFLLQMELKVIADVGFAGFPNAGKSTLLSVISKAQPKIADYPFTTLTPQLGVVSLEGQSDRWGESFVAADIPGLIEGASEGKGLGHEFLRHLERTQVIVYVLDGFSVEGLTPRMAYEKLRYELEQYSANLAAKRSFIVITKADLKEYNEQWEQNIAEMRELGHEMLEIAAVTREGIPTLKNRLYQIIEEQKAEAKALDVEAVPQENLDALANEYRMIKQTEDSSGLGL